MLIIIVCTVYAISYIRVQHVRVIPDHKWYEQLISHSIDYDWIDSNKCTYYNGKTY